MAKKQSFSDEWYLFSRVLFWRELPASPKFTYYEANRDIEVRIKPAGSHELWTDIEPLDILFFGKTETEINLSVKAIMVGSSTKFVAHCR